MSLGPIIGMLLPLLSKFLGGRSGDELAGMVNGNSSEITSVLSSLLSQGGMGGAGGPPVDPNGTLTTLMPLLMKQQPVIVVSDGAAKISANGNGLPQPVSVESIEPGLLRDILSRLNDLEGRGVK